MTHLFDYPIQLPDCSDVQPAPGEQVAILLMRQAEGMQTNFNTPGNKVRPWC